MRRSLDLLQRLGEHLQRSGADAMARDAAADVLRYFDRAAPAHHDDEERHVLPVLRRAGDATLHALAERLHEEHVQMACAWAEVRPALVALAEGGTWESTAGEIELARWRAFASLYAEHLASEDGVAFPFAEAQAGPDMRAAMGAEMAQRRGVAPPSGTGAHRGGA